jgi:hypothetical protein
VKSGYIPEMTADIIPLKNKYKTSSTALCFIWENDQIQDVKLKPLCTALTYKKLTIPAPQNKTQIHLIYLAIM